MYQLVLQFMPWGNRALNDLIALEDQLAAPNVLADAVDGHDIGPNEANIFIVTSEPDAALRRVMPYVQASRLASILGAGVRRLTDDVYARRWPVDDATAFRVR